MNKKVYNQPQVDVIVRVENTLPIMMPGSGGGPEPGKVPVYQGLDPNKVKLKI